MPLKKTTYRVYILQNKTCRRVSRYRESEWTLLSAEARLGYTDVDKTSNELIQGTQPLSQHISLPLGAA